jgi:hypothetical protein
MLGATMRRKKWEEVYHIPSRVAGFLLRPVPGERWSWDDSRRKMTIRIKRAQVLTIRCGIPCVDLADNLYMWAATYIDAKKEICFSSCGTSDGVRQAGRDAAEWLESLLFQEKALQS